MNGLILAAGAGRRLRPFTDHLPKSLVPVGADGSSVLDATLSNLAAAQCARVTIVVGYCAGEIASRVRDWETKHRLSIELIVNDRAEEWNNAYSLWCAREALADGCLLANGDTLHPASVTRTMLAVDHEEITLAIDDRKLLGDEEMKVVLTAGGSVGRISKGLAHDADGEYIGVSRIPAASGDRLVEALERTWTSDSNAFYEGAFQLLVDEGVQIRTQPIGDVSWIEIDTLDDLSAAKEMLCHS